MIYFSQYRNMTRCVIPDNITLTNNNFSSAFFNMRNLKTSKIPIKKITNMYRTYYDCYRLTGSPVCGNNVTNMYETYYGCENLTGNPICGENVTNMSYAYSSCKNLTGNPICGNNVTNMAQTYNSCFSLTGSPVCGSNVTNMWNTYANCYNLAGNAYFYSKNVNNIFNCFYGRNAVNILNIYATASSNTMTILLKESKYSSLVGNTISWTDDTAANGCYYNTSYNIYIYPVANVAEARVANGD